MAKTPSRINQAAKKATATQPVATMAPKSVPVTSVMPAPMATKANRSNVAKAKRATAVSPVPGTRANQANAAMAKRANAVSPAAKMPTQAQAMQAKAMLDAPAKAVPMKGPRVISQKEAQAIALAEAQKKKQIDAKTKKAEDAAKKKAAAVAKKNANKNPVAPAAPKTTRRKRRSPFAGLKSLRRTALARRRRLK